MFGKIVYGKKLISSNLKVGVLPTNILASKEVNFNVNKQLRISLVCIHITLKPSRNRIDYNMKYLLFR